MSYNTQEIRVEIDTQDQGTARGVPKSFTVSSEVGAAKSTARVAFPAAEAEEFAPISEGDAVRLIAGFEESPDGVALCFSGYVDRVERSNRFTTLVCEDEGWKLKRVVGTVSYEQAAPEQIVTDILGTVGTYPLARVPLEPSGLLMDFNASGMDALSAIREVASAVGWEFGFVPATGAPWLGVAYDLSTEQSELPVAILGQRVVSDDLTRVQREPVSQVQVAFYDPKHEQDTVIGVYPREAADEGELLTLSREGAVNGAAAQAEAKRIYELYKTSRFSGSLTVPGWPGFHAGLKFVLRGPDADSEGEPTYQGTYYAEKVEHKASPRFTTTIHLLDPGDA